MTNQNIFGNRVRNLGFSALRLGRIVLFSGLMLAGTMITARAQAVPTFASPQAAVSALVAAARTGDRGAIGKMFGPAGERLQSGDEAQMAEERARFAARADERTELIRVEDNRYTVEFGNDGWSLPVPIVRRGEVWVFDGAAGIQEMLTRRIGRNETDTILVCAAYALAQWDYFLEGDWNQDGVQEYAQQLVSTSGRKDGLYWATGPNEEPSPLGPLAAYAHAEGYRATRDAAGNVAATPFHGYYLKVLTGQGPSAAGGRYSYLVNGRMIAGFGLVAYPAVYGSSGVMTFIVNQQGKVYQKDLGPNTARVAAALAVYNPDASWEQVDYEAILAKR